MFKPELRPARPAGRQPRLRGEVRLPPDSPGGSSTPSSAANPPNLKYAGTTVVDRGALGFAVPGVVGFAGTFTDKEWMEIDTNPPGASPCAGTCTSHTRTSTALRAARQHRLRRLPEPRRRLRHLHPARSTPERQQATHGDYNELDARWTGAEPRRACRVGRSSGRIVVRPRPGGRPSVHNTGNRNENTYADRLVVAP